MTQAWWTAAMPRMKKFPDVKKLMARDISTPRKAIQTSEQQWAIFGAIAEAAKVLRKH